MKFIKLLYINIFLIIVLLFATGCYNFLDSNEKQDYSKRIVIKKIEFSPDYYVELYHYSLITGMSPSHIDIIRNRQITNICESSYISDILAKEQRLVIQLWKNDLETIESISKKNLGILIDTSGIQ